MNLASGADWPTPLAFVMIRYAWAATGIYFVASALFTNQIKRRERFVERLPDLLLFLGGFLLLFWQAPLAGMKNSHFLAPREALQITGVVFTFVGLPLTIWSRLWLGRYFSGGVALKDQHRLVQAGPYRVVRHPIYLGLILAAIGMAISVTTWTSLVGVVMVIICFVRRTQREDAFLASEFGAEFKAYRQRTGRLLPRIYS